MATRRKFTTVDLTHAIESAMSVFPGDASPKLAPENTYEGDGYMQTRLTLLTHTGTHMDAPAHIIPGGKTLDAFAPEHFMGSALIVNVRGRQIGRSITRQDIERHGNAIGNVDFLLFNTGWDAHWNTPAYCQGHPCLNAEALDLVASLPLKGVGFDTLSPDPIESADLPIHHRLLGKGDLVIIENLTNLDKCARLANGGTFDIACLPLLFKGADGSPARAIAQI